MLKTSKFYEKIIMAEKYQSVFIYFFRNDGSRIKLPLVVFEFGHEAFPNTLTVL